MTSGAPSAAAIEVAPRHVEVVGEPQRDREADLGALEGAVGRLDGADRRPGALREHHDGVTDAEGPAVHHAGVAPAPAGLAEHPLHRKPGSAAPAHPVLGRPPAGPGRLERVEHGRTVVPGRSIGTRDDVVAVQGCNGDHRARGDAEPVGQCLHLVGDALVGRAVPADEVHFVGAHDELVHAEQRGDADVAPRLLTQPGGGVDEHQRQIGRRCARRHVPGVLDVPGAVGDDELAVGGRGVAVGHIDRDALLALGAQAVGHEGQVDLAQPPSLRRGLNGGELVVEELTGIEEKASDQRALPVVHRSDGGEPQEIHGVDAKLGTAGRRRAGQRGHGSRSTPRACGPPWRSRRSGRPPGSRPARRSVTPRPRG